MTDLLLGFIWEWNANPEIWKPSPDSFFGLRWYSLLWAVGFIAGFYMVKAMFENEKKNLEDLDSLFMTMMLGTILGARIGHCLFYDFKAYFIDDPISIFKVWEGGLASHGALIGIMIALFVFVKRHSDYKKIFPINKIINPSYTYMWVLDRIVIPVSLAGGLIRMGNFFNHEIVGRYTDNKVFSVLFKRHYDSDLGYFDKLPRVPVQLYEAICYFLIFILLYRIYWKTKGHFAPGLIFGAFFTTVFGARFVLEFWKIADPENIYFGLNIGHILSIPVVIAGLVIWTRAMNKQKNFTL